MSELSLRLDRWVADAYTLAVVRKRKAQAVKMLRDRFSADQSLCEASKVRLAEVTAVMNAGRLCHISKITKELLEAAHSQLGATA